MSGDWWSEDATWLQDGTRWLFVRSIRSVATRSRQTAIPKPRSLHRPHDFETDPCFQSSAVMTHVSWHSRKPARPVPHRSDRGHKHMRHRSIRSERAKIVGLTSTTKQTNSHKHVLIKPLLYGVHLQKHDNESAYALDSE